VHLSRLHGLNVASPFILGHPGAGSGPADISILVDDERAPSDRDSAVDGRLVAAESPGRPDYRLVDRGADGYFYRIRDFVDIDISPDQRTLHCRLTEAASMDMLPVMLAGHVLATLLLLRGELVLHASAVEVDGGAVALVGNSGAGKSTLAALACREGARLVADDVLRVQPDAGGVRCYRGGSFLRLRPESKALAGASEEAHGAVSPDGRHLLAPAPTALDQLPLVAVLVPVLREPGHPVVQTRLDPKSALFSLLQFPRVRNWTDPQTSARQFDTLATVVQRVPVYTLDVPWGVPIERSWSARFAELLLEAAGNPAGRQAP